MVSTYLDAHGDFSTCADYYQKVYTRAFKKGIELARKLEGLRHIIAISSPGEREICLTKDPTKPLGQGLAANPHKDNLFLQRFSGLNLQQWLLAPPAASSALLKPLLKNNVPGQWQNCEGLICSC